MNLIIPKWLNFKSDTIGERVLLIHPVALYVLFHMAHYCQENELRFMITETKTTKKDDLAVQRKHLTHRQGRAFDLSIKSWSEQDIQGFISFFNKLYESIAAVSTTTGKATLVVDHGKVRHLHVQINARYKMQSDNLIEVSKLETN